MIPRICKPMRRMGSRRIRGKCWKEAWEMMEGLLILEGHCPGESIRRLGDRVTSTGNLTPSMRKSSYTVKY